MMTFNLRRDSFGKLVLTNAEGEEFVGVAPVRSFPVQAPTRGISLVRDGGKEVAWIDDLEQVAPEIRALVTEELEGREFMCGPCNASRSRAGFRAKAAMMGLHYRRMGEILPSRRWWSGWGLYMIPLHAIPAARGP